MIAANSVISEFRIWTKIGITLLWQNHFDKYEEYIYSKSNLLRCTCIKYLLIIGSALCLLCV